MTFFLNKVILNQSQINFIENQKTSGKYTT